MGEYVGSIIKGVRLIQSEGQAKLYFTPSIEKQTDQSGPSLPRGNDPSQPHRLTFIEVVEPGLYTGGQ